MRSAVSGPVSAWVVSVMSSLRASGGLSYTKETSGGPDDASVTTTDVPVPVGRALPEERGRVVDTVRPDDGPGRRPPRLSAMPETAPMKVQLVAKTEFRPPAGVPWETDVDG